PARRAGVRPRPAARARHPVLHGRAEEPPAEEAAAAEVQGAEVGRETAGTPRPGEPLSALGAGRANRGAGVTRAERRKRRPAGPVRYQIRTRSAGATYSLSPD